MLRNDFLPVAISKPERSSDFADLRIITTLFGKGSITTRCGFCLVAAHVDKLDLDDFIAGVAFTTTYPRHLTTSAHHDGSPARCVAIQVCGDVQPGSPGGSSFCYTAKR